MRFLYIRSILLLAISIFGAGCAHDVAYRHPPATEVWEKCSTACTGTSSVEFREYKTQDKDGTSTTGNYIIGYVEFDDQGWFHDTSQRTALFQAVQNYRGDDPDTQFLIVVYAHGWKHNSSGPDNDIDEFRKLLERLDTLEQSLAVHDSKKRARKVVGVYLGWRGASIQIPFIENVTFWTRKNTGERVGDRSAKQLLIELNEFRASLNCWKDKDRDRLANRNETQLILIGHSFGGMLMYHALHTELIEHALRLTQGKRDDGKLGYRYGLAKSFGDFILLVNPAFEGAAYEPLFRAATTRRYSESQRPVMAIVTSKSDWATKYAFPAGRLYTYAQSAPQNDERDTVLDTVGHLPRYITHELKYEPKARLADEKREGLSPTTKGQAEQTMSDLSGGLKEVEETGYTWYAGVKVISERKDLLKNFPYLVMSANSEIINGHNDIWNDRFVEFMVSFIAKEIMKVDQKPVEKKDQQNACVPFWLDSTER